MEIQAISSATATLAQSQTTNTSKASQSAAQKPVKTPPPMEGGAKPAAASSDSGGSSAKKIYDKQDANQDGVVSYQEELLYTLKHPPEETEEQPTVSTSQIQAGLKAYQQNSLLKT